MESQNATVVQPWLLNSATSSWKSGALLAKAAKAGNAEAARALLDAADPAYVDWHGLSPLIHAAGAGRLDILVFLLARARVSPLAMHMDVAREWAVAGGHCECADLLVRASEAFEHALPL